MKYRMIDVLRCQHCGKRLTLHPFVITKDNPSCGNVIPMPRCTGFCAYSDKPIQVKQGDIANDFNCSVCYSNEIVAGLLVCRCGSVFPVVDGVPRCLDRWPELFPDFIRIHRNSIDKLAIAIDKVQSSLPFTTDDTDCIRSSFSEEWGLFDYETDRTWGWDLDKRKRDFLCEMGLSEAQLENKLLLDAGCGNGSMSAALTTLGVEVIGLDLNVRLGEAQANRARIAHHRCPFVHYVQGDISKPPLATCSVDLIYSSGVIHHTANSQHTLSGMLPTLRPGGRVYVWVYSKRAWPIRAFFAAGRRLKRFLPLKHVLIICRVITPPYMLFTRILAAAGIMSFTRRTKRETTLALFDIFSPRYNHTHAPQEVMGWFQEAGLSHITVSGARKHGFGVYGDR